MTCQCCTCKRNSISLDAWADIMCFDQHYFWQQAQDEHANPGTLIPFRPMEPCNQVVYCHGGHSKVHGRREIYRAIAQADLKYRDYVGYWPRPTADCEEVAFAGNPRHCLRNSKLHKLGKERLDLVAQVDVRSLDLNNMPLDITDADGDGILDTVTIEVTAGIAVDELALFFAKDDWYSKDRCEHEIRGICVEPLQFGYQISWPARVFARPKTLCGRPQVYDPNDITIYPTSVDVYRRWVDDSQAVTYRVQPGRCGCHPCDCEQTCTCAIEVPGCACIISHELGVIELGPIDEGDKCCPSCIESACVHYVSGHCGDDELIARLTAAFLGRDVCCGGHGELQYWQADYVGVSDRGAVVTTLTELERRNPFGTRRGHIEAFNTLRSRPDRNSRVVCI